MNFAFKGRNGRGELVEGIVDAANSDAVAAQLMAGGVVPVSIEATTEAVSVAGGSNWLEALLAKPVTAEDTLVLTRQLYTLQKAGVPILRALAGLEASTSHPASRPCCRTCAPASTRAASWARPLRATRPCSAASTSP